MRRAFLWGSNANERYSRLEYAPADARVLGDVLRSERYGFVAQVHAQTEDPYDVHRALRRACAECKPDDYFIGHFSGHGQVVGGRLYFALDNSDPDDPSTLFASSWLIEAFRECAARNRLLILDCCHAGAATGVKDGGIPVQDLMPELRNELILYASGRLEAARELPEFEGSFLTRSLCKELESVRAGEPLSEIVKRLQARARQHNSSVPWTRRVPIPFLSGLQQGDFRFDGETPPDPVPSPPATTAAPSPVLLATIAAPSPVPLAATAAPSPVPLATTAAPSPVLVHADRTSRSGTGTQATHYWRRSLGPHGNVRCWSNRELWYRPWSRDDNRRTVANTSRVRR